MYTEKVPTHGIHVHTEHTLQGNRYGIHVRTETHSKEIGMAYMYALKDTPRKQHTVNSAAEYSPDSTEY